MENKSEKKIEILVDNCDPMSKKEQLFWTRFALIFGFGMLFLSFLAIFLMIFFGFGV